MSRMSPYQPQPAFQPPTQSLPPKQPIIQKKSFNTGLIVFGVVCICCHLIPTALVLSGVIAVASSETTTTTIPTTTEPPPQLLSQPGNKICQGEGYAHFAVGGEVWTAEQDYPDGFFAFGKM